MAKPKMLDIMNTVNTSLGETTLITEFTDVNKTRIISSEVGTVERTISPMGLSYALTGSVEKDSLSNNIFAKHNVVKAGSKQIYVYLANFINNTVSVGKLTPTPFTIPSGQFDNADSPVNLTNVFDKDDYCHPNIAYDATGVAGYKYWMIASILPAYNELEATWEDEDLFVSNDAITWERIKSYYEDAKTYTATGLSLPPQILATANARKYAFLPSPSDGEQIEISVPADNGAIALDRLTITLTGLPFKHDPAIFIDGGYVYTYHSFHVPYVDRTGGSSRFLVCVRTNDGINWEIVRTDGSTLILTEATSRQIFTKDAEGKYNYMYYAYNRNNSNPHVLKYGEGDYELVYGYNFTKRYKGTTPYNFDFTQEYSFQDQGSGNHPGLLLDSSTLYLINQDSLYVSANRGETFTKYDHPPMWLGGLAGLSYKKSMCIGPTGKVILVEAQRQITTSALIPEDNRIASTGRSHQLYITEYASVADLVLKAQDGLVDSYIDVQIVKTDFNGKRLVRFFPYISNNDTTYVVNSPLQRIKLADIDVTENDTLFIYVTLNTRNGSKIIFGGIEIS